jgi:hypothetical protein
MITTSIIVLEASDNKMLFNGETYGKRAFLSKEDSIDNWKEVPIEQYQTWLKEQEAQVEQ